MGGLEIFKNGQTDRLTGRDGYLGPLPLNQGQKRHNYFKKAHLKLKIHFVSQTLYCTNKRIMTIVAE